MKFFIYLSVLILFGCSHSSTNSDTQDVRSTFENPFLFLKDYDRFDIYCKSDTLSFYLEANSKEDNEYIYDIYSKKDKVKSGRFVYGLNFEDSDTLNLYFNCTSISLPKELCNQWVYFVKDSQSKFVLQKTSKRR